VLKKEPSLLKAKRNQAMVRKVKRNQAMVRKVKRNQAMVRKVKIKHKRNQETLRKEAILLIKIKKVPHKLKEETEIVHSHTLNTLQFLFFTLSLFLFKSRFLKQPLLPSSNQIFFRIVCLLSYATSKAFKFFKAPCFNFIFFET